jgi:hypothetical protein
VGIIAAQMFVKHSKAPDPAEPAPTDGKDPSAP